MTRRAAKGSALVPIASRATGRSPIAARRRSPAKPDPQQNLPEGRLRSGVSLRAGLHRERSAGAGHRLRRHARPEFVPPLRRAGRQRHGQSAGGQDRVRHRPGHFAVRQFLRSFIHLGFNQDESGRIVWDGVNPHIAARQNAMNFRFAVAGGAAEPLRARQRRRRLVERLRRRGAAAAQSRIAGPLPGHRRPARRSSRPSARLKFWGLRASPDLVGTNADRDIPLPANVRRYYFPGVTHGGGRGGFSSATSRILRRAASCRPIPIRPPTPCAP